jgi:hypothetical protein
MARLTKPMKLLEKYVSEKNLESESTTERLKDYPSSFHPNYTVRITKSGKMMVIVSFNAKQFYFDEIDEDEGKPVADELAKVLKDSGLTMVR